MTREIDQQHTQNRIARIAESRARKAGVPEEARTITQEVIAYRQAVKDQRDYFQANGRFHPGKLPALSPIADRVNSLDHLARFGEVKLAARRKRVQA